MCEIDWQILLEYFKVSIEVLKLLLGWPIATVIIAILLIFSFKTSLSRWIETRNFKGTFGNNTIELFAGQNTPKSDPEIKPLTETATQNTDSHIATSTKIEDIPEEVRDEPNIIAIVDFTKLNPIQVVRDYLVLNDAYLFERIFNRIFGTQLGLLTFLSSTKDWVYTEDVHNFYEKYIQKGGAMEYTEGQYVAFLLTIGLIEYRLNENRAQIQISIKGKKFVDYVLKNYTNEWHLKNL